MTCKWFLSTENCIQIQWLFNFQLNVLIVYVKEWLYAEYILGRVYFNYLQNNIEVFGNFVLQCILRYYVVVWTNILLQENKLKYREVVERNLEFWSLEIVESNLELWSKDS